MARALKNTRKTFGLPVALPWKSLVFDVRVAEAVDVLGASDVAHLARAILSHNLHRSKEYVRYMAVHGYILHVPTLRIQFGFLDTIS